MTQDRKLPPTEHELARRGYPETMNAKQVCTVLGVCRRTLHDLMNEGDLDAFRVRTQVRFERRDVANYIRVNRVRDEEPRAKPRPPSAGRHKPK
jgi:excisionase family DNA binding protein